MRRIPDSVLAPSIGVVLAERLPKGELWEGYVPFAPDIAVELELTESYNDAIAGKTKLYLATGTKCVWLLRPKDKTITIFNPDGSTRTLGQGDTLTGGSVLPEFSVELAEIFDWRDY